MITIICVGKIKEPYLEDMIRDYTKRINKYHKLEIVELKEEATIQKEGEVILKHIDAKDCVIACDISGKKMTSISFANYIDKTFISHAKIVFVIGSSLGIDGKVKNRADMLLSFSDFTMPHGLFRGVLLEQIYRSFKINNNESYHK